MEALVAACDEGLLIAVVEACAKITGDFPESGAGSDETTCSTLLHKAVKSESGQVIQILDHLLQKGLSVNVKHPQDGTTVLMAACQTKQKDVIKYLVKSAGADINLEDDRNMTCLHIVAPEEDMTSMVQLLLENNADVNIQNNRGNTALHLAALYNKKAAVQMLLEHGADRTILNKSNKIPADMPSASKEIAQLISDFSQDEVDTSLPFLNIHDSPQVSSQHSTLSPQNDLSNNNILRSKPGTFKNQISVRPMSEPVCLYRLNSENYRPIFELRNEIKKFNEDRRLTLCEGDSETDKRFEVMVSRVDSVNEEIDNLEQHMRNDNVEDICKSLDKLEKSKESITKVIQSSENNVHRAHRVTSCSERGTTFPDTCGNCHAMYQQLLSVVSKVNNIRASLYKFIEGHGNILHHVESSPANLAANEPLTRAEMIKDNLRKRYSELIESLEADRHIDRLFSKGVLDFRYKQDLDHEGVPYRKTKMLLDKLLQKPANKWVDAFIASLEEEQVDDWLVKELLKSSDSFA